MIIKLGTEHFDYDPETKTFHQEASTLANKFLSMFFPVFEDTSSVGFELVSKRTGDSVTMILVETKRDNDNDVQSWVFAPYNNDAFNKLVIFND